MASNQPMPDRIMQLSNGHRATNSLGDYARRIVNQSMNTRAQDCLRSHELFIPRCRAVKS